MPFSRDQLQHNLEKIREQIDRAAQRCGRRAEEIRLVATTKYVDVEVARVLVSLGQTLLGESRPQDLWQKSSALDGLPIEWHLIGHLQRNKVRRTLPAVSLIHSVDSQRLLAAIDEEAGLLGRTVEILLEVHISTDEAKHGFTPTDLESILARLPDWPRVRVRGLMGMASLEGGPNAARRDFAALRELRDRLQPAMPAGSTLVELSMGMSGDFAEAIAEGATLVRIGSALFEGIGQ
jgi:PLP dependent protein